MPLNSGTRLGPYELASRIGAGGMGEVFRARDTRLDRDIAVKVLSSEFASNASLRQRFEREARAISQLNHPHICTLHDVGSQDGVQYLVMELIDGESLADRLARGALPLADVLRYGAQIADALHAAHRIGIVHRDLKPGNIMLTRSGAKLLDFGLAKVTPVVLSPDAPTEQHKPLTAEGAIVGTFQYMAPEQLEGLEADARTDIFALGCVLYEMLTGQRPFGGTTRTSLIAAIVSAEPRSPRSMQPQTPAALEHLIQTCLQKERDARWQSAHDVAEQLRWVANDAQASPEQTITARSRGRRAAAIALALAAAAAFGAWVASSVRRGNSQPLTYAAFAPPRGVEIGTIGEDRPVLSPDGRSLVFIGGEENGKKRIWMRAFAHGEARVLPGTDGGYHPFWSPDGKAIAFFANGKLKRVQLDGSPPITICDVGSNPRGGAWNEEGVILFAPSSLATIHRVDATGGKPEPVTTFDTAKGEDTHRWPRFLPDGESFLFMAASGAAAENSEVNAVYASRLGSRERKLILHTRYHVDFADGKLLFVRGNTLFAQSFDPSKLELEGEPVELAKDVETNSDFYVAGFTAAANQLLYTTGAERRKKEIVWLDPTGKELGKVAPAGDYQSFAVSPKGDAVVVASVDASTGGDIWLYDLSRGTSAPLTSGESASSPVWTPDASAIAYVGAGRKIYLKSLGSDTPGQVIWSPEGWAGPASWSPDGKYLALTAFDGRRSTDYDVFVLEAGQTPRLIPVANTAAEEYAHAFSADGRWLTYVSHSSGRGELYAVSFPSLQRKAQISVGGAWGMIWRSPNEIWYAQQDGTFVSVTLKEVDGRLQVSRGRALFKDERIDGFDRVPGGERILAARVIGELPRPELVLVSNWSELLKRR